MDSLPTVCALTGVSLPAGVALDGENVSDILLGHPRARRGPLYWEWRGPVRGGGEYEPPRLCVRDGDWKLFAAADRGRDQLYRISTDPEERTNNAAQHADVVARLDALARAWQSTLPRTPAGSR